MKIGLVCSEPFYFPGGIQEQVKGLYKFLKSEGQEVKIIVPKYSSKESYGSDVIFGGMALSFEVFGSKASWSFILENGEIDKILKKEKFDILHFFSIGLFITLQILARSFSKNVFTFNFLPEKNLTYAIFSNLLKPINKENLGKIDKGTIPSKPVKEYIPKEYAKKILIVPNGIDLDRFKPENPKIKKFQDDKINILFVGRLDKRKGLEYLIKAYEIIKRKYKNIRLVVVGDGYSKEDCQKLVKERNIQDVVFEGYVKDEDIPKYYATCDIFCYPSVQSEAFGITLLEAMATGKPAIVTDIKGCRDVFKESKAILFVKPKSAQALSRGISKLIENEKLRNRMAISGLKEVKKYSWENVGKEFLKIYEDVLNGK